MKRINIFSKNGLLLFACLIMHHTVFAQKRINYTANLMGFDKKIAPDAVRLLGNTRFTDGSAVMFCDSAYYYEQTENIDAFGNVRIIPDKGNTTLTGKLLHYKGSDRIANITGGVKLIDDSATLTTETLFYNLNTGIANYPGKGTILSGKNKLVSDQGAYNKNLKEAYFKKNVVVTNPQFLIHTDTMNYNTFSKVVTFQGPTVINSNDNDSIYCEKGWYNTNTDISTFRQNAWIKGSGKTVKGDTLYYEKITRLGKAYGNIEMRDTSQNIIVRGNYASYDRLRQTALVTKKALMIQVDKKDSLYLHADTVYSGIFTLKNDSDKLSPGRVDTFKYVKAYHHVKFYRADLQGKADSLYYSFKDSTLEFLHNPVLWTDKNQLKAERIKLFIKNQKLFKMELTTASFVVTQEDSGRFNQIKGRNMTGFFANNELYKMAVKGNGQSLWFAKDDSNGEIMGVNKSESSDIIIYFKKRKLDRLTFLNSVNGALHPPTELKGKDLELKDFIWLDNFRPKVWSDVFIW